MTVGRSTGRPEGSARQATKRAPHRSQAIEKRIGENPCEGGWGSWGVGLGFQSHSRIIAWLGCRLSLTLRANRECCVLLRPLGPKPFGPVSHCPPDKDRVGLVPRWLCDVILHHRMTPRMTCHSEITVVTPATARCLSFSANETGTELARRHVEQDHSGRPRILASVPPRMRLRVCAGTSQASNRARY